MTKRSGVEILEEAGRYSDSAILRKAGLQPAAGGLGNYGSRLPDPSFKVELYS
jgi:hypothetical protein